jgi:Rap1a immunity proteins
MRNACLLLVVLVCVGTATGQSEEDVWYSGNIFLSTCALAANLPSVGEITDAEVFAIRVCFSYVRGLDDGMGVLRTPFCEPHVTNVQLLQILLKYIRDNPERAHLRTAELYLAAMEKAFPCTKK